MKRFLSKPLLPELKVSSVFISAKYPEFLTALKEKFEIEVLTVKENKQLTSAIASHADCALLQVKKNTFFIEEGNYDSIVNFLTIEKSEDLSIVNLNKSKGEIKSPYPDEVGLNAKVIGNRIICNTNYILPSVKEHCYNYGIKLIHCNQGYAACSTVVLNENAIITDDISIYNAAIKNDIDSLIINKGFIKLDGYDYGFIGGTCGMIDKNVLAFTGKIESHSDYKEIYKFFNKHNISYVELSDGPLVDIGGIIPILEKKA